MHMHVPQRYTPAVGKADCSFMVVVFLMNVPMFAHRAVTFLPPHLII